MRHLFNRFVHLFPILIFPLHIQITYEPPSYLFVICVKMWWNMHHIVSDFFHVWLEIASEHLRVEELPERIWASSDLARYEGRVDVDYGSTLLCCLERILIRFFHL